MPTCCHESPSFRRPAQNLGDKGQTPPGEWVAGWSPPGGGDQPADRETVRLARRRGEPVLVGGVVARPHDELGAIVLRGGRVDRKSTRLNSSHSQISYAVFCLKKKKITAVPHSS